MNPKDEAVDRQAARGRIVNVEFETVRKEIRTGTSNALAQAPPLS